MLPSEGSEILRVAVLSGVVGFAGFCISTVFMSGANGIRAT
jgi:hypothetical protein